MGFSSGELGRCRGGEEDLVREGQGLRVEILSVGSFTSDGGVECSAVCTGGLVE